jgi:hypothetical protein
MANPLNLLNYMRADLIRQRSNADRLAHMHVMGAMNAMAPAITALGGARLNAAKGLGPFQASAARRGLITVAINSPHAAHTIHVAVPAPAPARRRRGRARK